MKSVARAALGSVSLSSIMDTFKSGGVGRCKRLKLVKSKKSKHGEKSNQHHIAIFKAMAEIMDT
jgi:hypothetical protein